MSADETTAGAPPDYDESPSSSSIAVGSLSSEEPPTKRRRLETDLSKEQKSMPPAHQSYLQSTAQGNSRAHFGNNYYNGPVYTQSNTPAPTQPPYMIADRPPKAHMSAEVLAFDTMDDRFYTIEATYAGTCQWLFERDEYKGWRDPANLHLHNGFLWLKGKPGSGKSTLMKFAFEWDQKEQQESLSVSYFFNARGGDMLQKTSEGMYRSLLYQIYDRMPHLLHVLQAHTRSNRKGWPLGRLKSIFRETILALGAEPLTCYIDALDECAEESEVRDMVHFFEALGESAAKANVRFYVLFSSRHYPHITIQKCQHLTLDDEEGHESDINDYVRSHLHMGTSKLALEMQSEVQRKASGVFLWVVLVIRILNESMDRGNVHQLREHLHTIPEDLDALFSNLLQKAAAHEKASLVLVLQLVLFSHAKLMPEDLYFAVMAQCNNEDIEAWVPDAVSLEDMRKFILNVSKGLLETRDATSVSNSTVPLLMVNGSDRAVEIAGRPAVQFMHASVRDYLLGGGLYRIVLDSSDHTLQAGCDFKALCHDQLKMCCHQYVLRSAHVTSHLGCEGLEEASSVDLESQPKAVQNAKSVYPFLDYALSGMIHHADMALSGGIPQDTYVDKFPFELWSKIYNGLRTANADRLSPSVSRLYIFVVEGALHLAAVEMSLLGSPTNWDCNMPAEGHPSLLSIAVARDDFRMVDLLLKRGANVNSLAKHDLGCLSFAIARARDHELTEAQILANTSIIAMLLEHGADADYEGRDPSGPLRTACQARIIRIVRMMLDHGADIRHYYLNMIPTSTVDDRNQDRFR
ncbi:hypothetical protein Q7P37_004856 [Cladosporium fusiforme]